MSETVCMVTLQICEIPDKPPFLGEHLELEQEISARWQESEEIFSQRNYSV